MYSVSAVLTEDSVSGAVISLTAGRQIEEYTRESRREMLGGGEGPRMTFEQLPFRSAAMQRIVDRARRFSSLMMPILITGEAGTEKSELARCIYEASPLHVHGFVWFDCAGAPPDEIYRQLFGENALIHQLKGTLFLEHAEMLSTSSQHSLYRFLYNQRYAETADPWIIAGCDRDPEELIRTGTVRRDLMDALDGLILALPPLRQRPEDITAWLQHDLKALQPRFGRYLHLTQAAWKRVRKEPFYGNVNQVHSFCRRMLAQAPRRTVDEKTVDLLLPAELPADEDIGCMAAGRLNGTAEKSPLKGTTAQNTRRADGISPDPEELQIRRLLRAYYGSRSEVAAALGISTTTLWRRMKKYGIAGTV